jgi:hypothetical protein
VTTTISCPGCDKKLRFGKRPEEGKKVKCPACGKIFVPALEDEAEAVAIQEQPSRPARSGPAARRRDEADDVDPVARRRGRDEDDDDDDGSDRSRRREEEDERPSRKKKTKRKAGNKGLVIGLIGGGVFLLLLVCGGLAVLAFLWPGFMVGKPRFVVAADREGVVLEGKQQQSEPPVNLNAYLLADADLLIGAHAKGLRDVKQFDAWMNALRSIQPNGLPRGFEEIARDCDRVLASMSLAPLIAQATGGDAPAPPPGPPQKPFGPKGPKGPAGPQGQPPGPGPKGPPNPTPKVLVALLLSGADAAARAKNVIRSTPNMGTEEKLAGKYAAFRYHEPGSVETTLFVFPSERVLVLSPSTEQEVLAALDRAASNPPFAPQMAKMVGLVDQAQVWAAYTASAQARQAVAGLSLLLGDPKVVPPEVHTAVQALGKARGMSLAVDALAGGGVKVQMHLDFDDADAAQKLKQGADAFRQMANAKGPPNDPNVPRSLAQDYSTLTFSTQGTVASGSITVSEATLRDMSGKFAGQKQGAQPPKNNPPQGRPPTGQRQSHSGFKLPAVFSDRPVAAVDDARYVRREASAASALG